MRRLDPRRYDGAEKGTGAPERPPDGKDPHYVSAYYWELVA